MESIPLQMLSEPIRSFLADVANRGGVIVKDDCGRPCFSVNSLRDPTPEEQSQALAGLRRIQERVQASMDSQGVTEDDLDRLLQEDD